ncbi:hypothetical protein [Paenibacillus sp. GCM10012303]
MARKDGEERYDVSVGKKADYLGLRENRCGLFQVRFIITAVSGLTFQPSA